MYAEFFGLQHAPFSIAPDPRYLFMSERHREALAHLLYGLEGGGGFVLVTGEIGTGKTTVCRCFLEQIPAHCNVAYIFNPKLTVAELLQTICDELHIDLSPSQAGVTTVKQCIDPLNTYLLAQHAAGRNTVLIIDEAQNLSPEVLEQLRLLTNLETNERKLLQIVLIGQPELRSMLAAPGLEQLGQRVIARFHLDALTPAETGQYIRHRLTVAGLSKALPFDSAALQQVYALSRGVPRRINLLCDRALLGAYAHALPAVTPEVLQQAAREVFDATPNPPPSHAAASRVRPVWWAALGLAGLGLAAVAGWNGGQRSLAPAPVHASAPPTAATAATARAPAMASAAAPLPLPGASRLPVLARSTAPSAPGLRSGTDLQQDLGQLPRQIDTAWQQLGQAWGLALPASAVCAAAQQVQLRCFGAGKLSLEQVAKLGRPGILTLVDAQGRSAYAVLSGLSDQGLELRVDGRSQRYALGALAGLWRGQFDTFWQVPTQSVEAQLQALPAGAGAGTLAQRVAAFQLAQGLTPDGVVGPITQMLLNRASDLGEPRLAQP